MGHIPPLDHTMQDAHGTALTDGAYRVIVGNIRGHGTSMLSQASRSLAPDVLDDLWPSKPSTCG